LLNPQRPTTSRGKQRVRTLRFLKRFAKTCCMVLEEAADKRPGNGWFWKKQGWRSSDILWASEWVGR
jgi:hypothetical protein